VQLFFDSDSVNDVVVEEVLFPAWDLNQRSPRLFSKWAYENLKDDPEQVSNLKYKDMILASGTTPYYFKASTLTQLDADGKTCKECADSHLYISGDNVALSPAMYAFLHANEKKNVAPGNIRIVSVGNINELAERINT